MTTTALPYDPAKLDAAVGRFLGDVGAVITAASVLIGDRLGLYKALATGGAQTSAELSKRTQTHERYVREWLANQAAAGYIEYDPQTRRFCLPPEHVPLLADDASEVNMCGLFGMGQPLFADEPKVAEAFKTGKGVGWHEHDSRLYGLTDRIFRNGYASHLVADWIPALEGVESKLRTGAIVADVGCGFGSSTILMAKAYRMSTFVGYDYHEPSIVAAREAARRAGVEDRTRFEVAWAKAMPDRSFDLVCCFDCVHDMGDPVGALTRARDALKANGTLMIVEPYAADALEENLTPIGRIFYGASTMLCTPSALAQEVGFALGAQAGEARMREVATKAGFSHFRRATQTPFNIVYEARP
ncbi:MAG TPA: methyltransferase domain-containing protein [Candidatus Cybelea sp.]|nr:methyltransferase domain-containing protein [Candidatus Cybelea sp.]